MPRHRKHGPRTYRAARRNALKTRRPRPRKTARAVRRLDAHLSKNPRDWRAIIALRDLAMALQRVEL